MASLLPAGGAFSAVSLAVSLGRSLSDSLSSDDASSRASGSEMTDGRGAIVADKPERMGALKPTIERSNRLLKSVLSSPGLLPTATPTAATR